MVSTAVGDVPHFIGDGGGGLVVPPGDPTALVDALQRVVCDPALRERLGAGALRRSAMLDVTSASREVEGIYRQVAGIRR